LLCPPPTPLAVPTLADVLLALILPPALTLAEATLVAELPVPPVPLEALVPEAESPSVSESEPSGSKPVVAPPQAKGTLPSAAKSAN
jgi:hypothetical protein